MIKEQFRLDLNDELFVDNFAGGGGASTGIFMGLGRHVDHAINHDRFALGMHRINHPQTVHHCEDIYDIMPKDLAEGRPIGGAWFSPDCKHHSKAKGGKPRDKKIRALAFVMLRYAKYRTRVMYMENVEEIAKWGPLLPDGKPDKQYLGRTWKALLAALSGGLAADHPDMPEILEALGDSVTKAELVRGFGYDTDVKEIRACVYGTPTIRKRLYMIARCDGRPIVWPKETHAEPEKARALGLKKYRIIAECLDFTLPCPSIFLTKEQARKFRCRRPLKRNTLRRAARGIDRYVLKAKRPFIISLTHQGGDRVESMDAPANTITGAHRGEKAVVSPTLVNTSNSKTTGRGPNTWSVGEPGRTITSAPGFSVVQASLISEQANATHQRNFPTDEPLRTQCAEVKGGHFSEVACSLIQTGYGERKGQEPRALDIEKPLGTVVAGGGKHAVVTAHLCRDFGQSVGQPVTEAGPTVMPGGQGKTKMVAATLVGAGGPTYGGKPIAINRPGNSQTTENHTAVVAASIVKLRGDNVGHGADEPGHTISAGGTHHALQTVYLAQNNDGFNTNPGHAADEPGSTINTTGSQQSVVMGSVIKYYGTDQDPRLDESAHSVTTKDRFGLNQTLGVYQPLTPEQLAGARRVAAFLREFGVEFEGEFATVQGYVLVDIGLRMLTPRELFCAQGFPYDYVIDRAWVVDPKTGEIVEIHLTKEQQIRMCGNSVCPQVAAALVRANNPEMVVRKFRTRELARMERMAA